MSTDATETPPRDDFPSCWEWGNLFAANPALIKFLEAEKDESHPWLTSTRSPITKETRSPKNLSSPSVTPPVRAYQLVPRSTTNDSSVSALVVDYANGMPQEEIAIKHRLHVQTIRKSLKEAGVNTRRHNSVLSASDLHQARGLMESGQSLRQTAQQFGVAHTTLQRALKKNTACRSPW